MIIIQQKSRIPVSNVVPLLCSSPSLLFLLSYIYKKKYRKKIKYTLKCASIFILYFNLFNFFLKY